MKKHLICLLLICFILASFTSKSYADAGPKASVNVHVKGIEGDYIITLLSDVQGSGPHRIDSINYINDSEEHKKLMEKFLSYQDDEYYNIGYYDLLSDEDDFTWGYYPPDHFKVLIYSIDKDEFYISDKCSRYAFYSFFNADLKDGKLAVNKNLFDRNIGVPFLGLTSGVLIMLLIFLITLSFTLFVEILLAFLFKYKKPELIYIAKINVTTQILLYILIVLGSRYTMAPYIVLIFFIELFIWILEPVLYAIKFDRKFKAVVYGILANFLSYFLFLMIFICEITS